MKKTLGTIVTIIVAVILIGIFITVKSSSAEEASDGRFIAYDDGTVLDTETNLLWAAADNGKNINWEDAKSYCENYRGGDYKEWRMPTKDELKKLHNRVILGNNGYHITKLITLSGAFQWASNIKGSEASVYSFGHNYGLWIWDSLRSKWRNRVLPVRSGREGKVVAIEQKQEPPAPVPVPAPVPAPVVVPVPAPPPPPFMEKVTIRLNVEFDTAKSVVKEKYRDDIKKVADFMKTYPETKAVIEGHTDNVDIHKEPERNMRLSQTRADIVRQYLIDNFGIDASRLTAVGYGPERPIASNDTKEGRQKNRRIDAVIETMREK
jgi:Outer membrane protein and related peptidoglycan-associated (lipo)proteins